MLLSAGQADRRDRPWPCQVLDKTFNGLRAPILTLSCTDSFRRAQVRKQRELRAKAEWQAVGLFHV